MKINLSEKIIAWLTLFSGLAVSAVAVYYSVAGLVSIFAAAVIPIIVMGVALEVKGMPLYISYIVQKQYLRDELGDMGWLYFI
jgi:hypothetical protein